MATSKATSKESKSSQFNVDDSGAMPLALGNFIAMIIAGVLIIAGFLLMLGGSSTTEAFNPDIFSIRRIVVGPFLAFIGFVAMGAAIIIDPARLPFGKKK